MKPSARFGARLDGKTDKDRRPFAKAGAGGAKKPTFTKPWEEDRKPRDECGCACGWVHEVSGGRRLRIVRRWLRGSRLGCRWSGGRRHGRRRSRLRSGIRTRRGRKRVASALRSKPRSYESKERTGGFCGEAAYVKRDGEGGAKPFAKRPYTPRGEGAEGSFAKRPYVKRDAEGGAKPFAKRPYTPRGEGGAGSFAKKPYAKRDAEGGAKPFAKRPYTPRTEEGGGRADFVQASDFCGEGRRGQAVLRSGRTSAREGGTRSRL